MLPDPLTNFEIPRLNENELPNVMIFIQELLYRR